MRSKLSKVLIITGLVLLLALVPMSTQAASKNPTHTLTNRQKLGQFLYFDENLSEPDGQSCASCHEPEFGFADPDSEHPVSEGVIPGLFGGRNAPSSAYAMYAPKLHYNFADETWVGGQFWDGRATGAQLGDPLADQALAPFLNPVEMANPSKSTVIDAVKASSYADLFKKVWGKNSLNNVDKAYNAVVLSIAAFERTQQFGQFSSKYDAYLAACLSKGGNKKDCARGNGRIAQAVGQTIFTGQEWQGFQLFMDENNNDGILTPGEGAGCAGCHVVDWTRASSYALPVQVPAWAPRHWVPPLFTDFTYDNLGISKSTDPILENNPVDLGLGPIVGDDASNGQFKVMSLRNIALTAPTGHNGYFITLEDIVHFYNTRDVPGSLPGGLNWDAPEYPATVNHDELGDLGLSAEDEAAVVEFMKTLSDGYQP